MNWEGSNEQDRGPGSRQSMLCKAIFLDYSKLRKREPLIAL